MAEYEININTLALIPIAKDRVKVYEVDNEFIVEQSIMKIINDSCKYFGSNYAGRVDGTKRLINVSVKAPIIIEESKEIIFFPTASPRIIDCSWIAFNHVKKYLKYNKKTVIFFNKGNPLELPISYNIIDNQLTRSIKLHMALLNRKKSLKKEIKLA